MFSGPSASSFPSALPLPPPLLNRDPSNDDDPLELNLDDVMEWVPSEIPDVSPFSIPLPFQPAVKPQDAATPSRNTKRKYDIINCQEDDQGEKKLRRKENNESVLGKGTKPPVWYSCLLALDRHEQIPCRILCKEVYRSILFSSR